MVLIPNSFIVSKQGTRPTSDSVEYLGCCAYTQVKDSNKTAIRINLGNLRGME
jgi:hypothetical protein